MSILERAAEFLRPAERPGPQAARPEGEGGQRGLDLIERAVREIDARPAPDGELSAPSGARGAAQTAPGSPGAAARTSRSVSIDLERLRRQGIVTPDDGARTPIGESLRRVKRHILMSAANAKAGSLANLVLVTSALAQEGKTFCAINLAISIALEMDHKVLLVDADVAKPSVPRALGIKAEKGLMDVLLDRRLDLAEVLCRTNIDKLTFLSAGTPHRRATELLASDAMGSLLRELAARYRDRIVIFDSPPLLAASEAGVLTSQMGQIVMVVEAGRTSEAVLNHALSLVESGNVGMLLNKGEDTGLGYGYGYEG